MELRAPLASNHSGIRRYCHRHPRGHLHERMIAVSNMSGKPTNREANEHRVVVRLTFTFPVLVEVDVDA